jgi:hypothetical protein
MNKPQVDENTLRTMQELLRQPPKQTKSLEVKRPRVPSPCHENHSLSVPLQLPLSPMCVLAIGVELAHDVAIQGSHDANASEHRRATKLCD